MIKTTQEIINLFTNSEINNKKTDYLKHENSNFIYGLPLLRHQIDNFAEESYLMNNIYSDEIRQLNRNGNIYIHDKKLAPYCVSLSCKDIATKGVPTLATNMLCSQPTKKLNKLLRHFSNAVTLMSQQVSGAVMLSQFTTVTASYLYESIKEFSCEDEEIFDKYCKNIIYEELDSFIWELNMPLRAGSQSPFTNITLDFNGASKEIKDDYVIIGGELKDYKYNDIPLRYYETVNKVIIEIMSKGGNGIPFTFPLITVQVFDDTVLPSYLLNNMWKFGGLYFENFKTKPFKNNRFTKDNPYIKAKDPEVSRSMCCRLNIDLSVLSKVGSGGIFGSSVGNTGAVQVITINLNRLFLETVVNNWTKAQMFARLYEIMRICQEAHMKKREWIENNKDLYPTFFAYNENLKNYFNVFGIIGMHEGLLNYGIDDGINSIDGRELAHEIMQFMTEKVNEFIVQDKVACGIESPPAENASIKLARDDKRYSEINNLDFIHLQGQGDNVMLSSGCSLPRSSDYDLGENIVNHAYFQGYSTSGSVYHYSLSDKLSEEDINEIINKLFSFPINYITITFVTCLCHSCNHKYIIPFTAGICPKCSSKDISIYDRVIGYIKPVVRRNINTEGEMVTGDYNYWSSTKRLEWATIPVYKKEYIYDVFLPKNS